MASYGLGGDVERGFILHPTYLIERDRAVVHLFGVTDEGVTFVVRDTRVRPSFFLRCVDVPRAEPILEAARRQSLAAEGGSSSRQVASVAERVAESAPQGQPRVESQPGGAVLPEPTAGAGPAASPELAEERYPRIGPGTWRTMKGEEAVEVLVAIPPEVPPLRDRLQAAGINCHEADVPFVSRYLCDRGICGAMQIAGPSRAGRRVDRIYEDPSLAPEEFEPTLKVLSLDIETDLRAQEVRSVALYANLPHGGRVSEVHFRRSAASTANGMLDEGRVSGFFFEHPDEPALLAACARRLREIDPDVLTGWNVVDFDLRVLEQAFGRCGVPFYLGRADLPCRVWSRDENWMTSRATVHGRVVVDGMDLVRGAFIRLDTYALDVAARELLGEGKTITAPDRGAEIERLYQEDLTAFLDYNLTDARLVIDILETRSLVPLAVRRALLTGLPLDRVSASIAAFDFLYIGALHRRGIVAPSVHMVSDAAQRPEAVRSDRPAGAQRVMATGAGLMSDTSSAAEPGTLYRADSVAHSEGQDTEGVGAKGVGAKDVGTEDVGAKDVGAKDVGTEDVDRDGVDTEGVDAEGIETEGQPAAIGGYVLDSLPGIYSNVWLFDYQSLYPSIIRTFQIDPLGHARAQADPAEPAVTAPNGVRFPRQGGILPELLANLIPRRLEAKRRGHQVESWAIKILMNSFYGVLASPRCRFYSTYVSNAITTFGQQILLWTKAQFEQRGYQVIYGDTDSLFVVSGIPLASDAENTGRSEVSALNEALRRFVRNEYGMESHLLLEFERQYVKFFMPSLRHTTGGSKKRYAGVVERGGVREIVFTGLESVRRDWTVLAKDFQRHLLTRVFAEEPVDEFIREFLRELRAGDRDGDLVYRKALRKRLSEYGKTTPPHVKAARLIPGKPGRLISYVVTTDGPQPVGHLTASPDYNHYIEKQLRPIGESILQHIGRTFDEYLGRGDQLGLL